MARYDLHHAKRPLEVSLVTGQGAEVVEFTAGGTVTAGETVQLDVSQSDEDDSTYVVQGTASALTIGVALESAVADGTVRVCTSGYIEGVNANAGIAAGEALYPAASGEVDDSAAGATLPCVAVALTAISGGTCNVYWFRRY